MFAPSVLLVFFMELRLASVVAVMSYLWVNARGGLGSNGFMVLAQYYCYCHCYCCYCCSPSQGRSIAPEGHGAVRGWCVWLAACGPTLWLPPRGRDAIVDAAMSPWQASHYMHPYVVAPYPPSGYPFGTSCCRPLWLSPPSGDFHSLRQSIGDPF